MKKVIISIITVMFLFTAFGCGGGGKKMVKDDNIPDWYLNPPTDPDYYFGTNSSTSQRMQLAVDKAKAGARTDIAQQLEVQVKSLTKKFEEEVGSGENSELNTFYNQTMKSIASQTLNGSTVKQKEIQKEGTHYRAYVLMQLPKASLKSKLVNKVKQKKNLYERFRASEAFKEMEEDVDKYEQYKKEEGNY